MEQRDVDNLNFLLGLTPTALKQWYEQASEDDVEYASELLDTYEQELDTIQHEINITDPGYVFKTVKTLQ